MEHVETAKVTSKGQITIPAMIREILKVKPGSTVMFKVTKGGVLISPCEVVEKPAYSSGEWKKIERMVAEKGKTYKTSKAAKKHLEDL